jgi:ABC-type sugar transport system permease subunit
MKINQKILAGKKDTLTKWPYIFMSPFLFSFLAFKLYPTLYSLYISFFDWDGFSPKIFSGINNYLRIIFNDSNFRLALWNTIRIVLCSIPLTIVIGVVLAAFLSSFTKGRRLFETLNFLPYITTPVAIGFIFAVFFDQNSGYVNIILRNLGIIKENIFWIGEKRYAPYIVSLMIIWKNFGYYMVLYLAGISSIPQDMFEAAKIDGSNAVNTFFKITLPQLTPITIFVIITGLIGGLQLFDEPVLLFRREMTNVIGGPGKTSLTVNWLMYDMSFGSQTQWGYGSAISFTLFVIIGVLSLIGMKLMSREDNL